MAFNTAQYQAAVDGLSSGLADLSAKLDSIPGKAKASADRWWVPDPLSEAIIFFGEKMCEIGSWILDALEKSLEGAVGPVYMFIRSYEWETIRGLASTVSGQLQPGVVGSTDEWQGSAATAYTKEIGPQAGAASSISSIASKISSSLVEAATAGLAFYLVLGVVAIKFITVLAASIVALGSGIFSWAGFLALLEEAGVSTAVIVTVTGALVTFLGVQAKQMVTLHGQAVDNSAFPGGHWPTAVKTS